MKQPIRWTMAVLLTITAPVWILPVLIGAVLLHAVESAKGMIDGTIETWRRL